MCRVAIPKNVNDKWYYSNVMKPIMTTIMNERIIEGNAGY